MDSSSSSSSSSSSFPQNWLGFSLSNHPHLHSHPQHHHLSLFEAFTSSNPASVVDTAPHEGDASAGGATDMAIFTAAAAAAGGGGPKLEDFLGGCGGGGGGSTTTTTTATPSLTQFSTETTAIALPDSSEIYDSELKTIAASFLRGYSSSSTNEHTETGRNQLPVVSAEPTSKKSVDTFGQRTSIYRGVTRHRWTGRYEAHLWDNSCRREGQSRKGRQVYLGGYDKEEKAARAYDLAALKYWGPTTTTNFPVSNYEKELEEMKNMTRQEFVASLRRKSSGFSRGASIYRGVTRHHQHGRWQARIGRVAGNKDLYLGTFSTQEEAAEAYDIAAIKFRGLNAVTNFDMSRYDVKSIASSNLPIGGMSGKSNKNSSESVSDNKSIEGSRSADEGSSVTFASQPTSSSTLSFAIPIKQDPSDYWSNIFGFHNHNNVNAKNNPSLAPTLFHNSSSSVPFNMDFSAESNNGFFNTSSTTGYATTTTQQQQQSSVSVSVSSGSGGSSGNGNGNGNGSTVAAEAAFSTQIALNNNNSYETSSGYGSWIGPTLHTFQTHAKPSLFQTPIFGME